VRRRANLHGSNQSCFYPDSNAFGNGNANSDCNTNRNGHGNRNCDGYSYSYSYSYSHCDTNSNSDSAPANGHFCHERDCQQFHQTLEQCERCNRLPVGCIHKQQV
jgi:hypothetical protein